MGTHPIFESDFDCLTDGIVSDRSALVFTVPPVNCDILGRIVRQGNRLWSVVQRIGRVRQDAPYPIVDGRAKGLVPTLLHVCRGMDWCLARFLVLARAWRLHTASTR